MLNIKKNKKNIKIFVIAVIVFTFVLSIFGIKRIILMNKKIYDVDSRIDKVKEEIKKEKDKNYKTIGWLRVQGTNIDTPIINIDYSSFGEEDDDELIIDKKNYLWNDINEEKLLNKININGHNILNLSSHPDVGLDNFTRFDDLMAFVYYDFAKENKYIQYSTKKKDYIYEIYSVEFVKEKDLDVYVYENYTKKELEKNIKKSLKNSIYKYNVKVDGNDKIISLITCTRMFGDNANTDFVVNAKLVDKKELKNYGMSKTKNYKKIKDILESEVKENEA